MMIMTSGGGGAPCLIKELNGLFIINIPLGAAEIHPLADISFGAYFVCCLVIIIKRFFEFLVIQVDNRDNFRVSEEEWR